MMLLVNRLLLLVVITTSLLAMSQQEDPHESRGANWLVKKIAVEAYGGESGGSTGGDPYVALGRIPPPRPLAINGSPRSDIVVIASPNTKPKRLAQGLSPAWSADGAKIAYCVREGRGFGQVQLINADGSGHRQLPKLKDGACLPDWSPDGQRLAVTAYDSDGTPLIFVLDKDGQNITQVAAGYGGRWSPDGERLVFCRHGKGPAAVSSIWTANSDGTGVTKVMEDKASVLEAAWWPDGQSIIFTSDREHQYRSALYRVHVNGTGLETIAADKGASLYFPVPSPDGKQIVVDVYPADFLGSRREMLGFDTVGGSQVILLDLASHQSRLLAYGKHPSVIWERP